MAITTNISTSGILYFGSILTMYYERTNYREA